MAQLPPPPQPSTHFYNNFGVDMLHDSYQSNFLPQSLQQQQQQHQQPQQQQQQQRQQQVYSSGFSSTQPPFNYGSKFNTQQSSTVASNNNSYNNISSNYGNNNHFLMSSSSHQVSSQQQQQQQSILTSRSAYQMSEQFSSFPRQAASHQAIVESNTTTFSSDLSIDILMRSIDTVVSQQQQQSSSEILEDVTQNSPKSSKSDADGSSKNYGSAFLGPNLWDKTDLFQGEKLKFEYLEMDDFLTENGLDAADVELLDQKIDNPQPQQQQVQLATNNNVQPSLSSHSEIVTINTSKANIANNTSVLSSLSTISIHAPVNTTSSNGHPPPMVQSSLPVHVNKSASSSLNTNNLYGGKQLTTTTSNSSSLSGGYDYGFSPSAMASGDLSMMSGSGGSSSDSSNSSDDYDQYNPGMRKFTDEELKPQPMLKKSKKQTIPSEMKDDKYWQRRRKNNVAAKRSRDARRVKENHIALRASYLEKENDLLRKQLEESRSESRQLKSRLSHYEAIHQAAGAKGGSPN